METSRRTTLITGITGFIGGAVGAHLLHEGEDVVALVRAPGLEEARARVAQSLARFGVATQRLSTQLEVILGDLALHDTYESSAFDTATHVVHAAACTSFVSTRETRRSNVLGTSLLARRMCRAPRLSRFLHVSTAYCCGIRPNRVVYEEDFPLANDDYVNDYSRTKAEAEGVLRSMADELPLLIARPSVVIGHTSFGVSPSPSLFWYYRALAALGAGPFTRTSRRDIVPVDWVADALHFLLHLARPRFATYHVSAGATGAVRIDEILRCFGATQGWRTATPDELATMAGPISELVRSMEEARAVARGIAACARFGTLGVDCFDNERLSSEGFHPAPRFTEYLPRCIETSGDRTIHEQMVDEV